MLSLRNDGDGTKVAKRLSLAASRGYFRLLRPPFADTEKGKGKECMACLCPATGDLKGRPQ